MEVRVLGCYGGEMPGFRTTCMMVDGKVLIDAGAATGALTIEEQLAVDAIVLTHSHLDHVRDLGFLADNIFGQREKPVAIYGLPETIRDVKKHVLNNLVWPDFSQLPTPENSVITFNEIREGETVEIEGISFTPVLVDHSITAGGYLIENGDRSFVFSGDTGPTENLWHEANKLKGLSAVFLEISFPDRMTDLAKTSGHLTPKTALNELDKIDHEDYQALAFHMKPQYLGEIVVDIGDDKERIRPLEQGDRIEV